MNYDVIDLDTTNLVASYRFAEEAWSALRSFGEGDYAVFEVLPDGRRRLQPVTIERMENEVD